MLFRLPLIKSSDKKSIQIYTIDDNDELSNILKYQLYELCIECFPLIKEEETIKALLNPGKILMTIVENNKLIGACSFELWSSKYVRDKKPLYIEYISIIMIAKKYRGQGLAQKVIDMSIKITKPTIVAATAENGVVYHIFSKLKNYVLYTGTDVSKEIITIANSILYMRRATSIFKSRLFKRSLIRRNIYPSSKSHLIDKERWSGDTFGKRFNLKDKDGLFLLCIRK